MPLSSERLANVPLNGQELKEYSRKLLTRELVAREVPDDVALAMVLAFDTAMDKDFISRETAAYPEVVVELNVKAHFYSVEMEWAFAFEIEPVFHTINILAPKHIVVVRSPKPPMKEFAGRGTVVAFQLTSKVENPNLVRVHYGIPIVIQKRKEPEPGQMFADIVSETLEYTPEDFPGKTLSEPLVIDQTEEVEALWGIRMEAQVVGASPDPDYSCGAAFCDDPACNTHGKKRMEVGPKEYMPAADAVSAAVEQVKRQTPPNDPDNPFSAASHKKNRKGWNKTSGNQNAS
jgi:hypothetical protein